MRSVIQFLVAGLLVLGTTPIRLGAQTPPVIRGTQSSAMTNQGTSSFGGTGSPGQGTNSAGGSYTNRTPDMSSTNMPGMRNNGSLSNPGSLTNPEGRAPNPGVPSTPQPNERMRP